MTLQESVNYHVRQLLKETFGVDDAKNYIDETVKEVQEEHPNTPAEEIQRMILEALER
jgi:ribosomal protein L7/L12